MIISVASGKGGTGKTTIATSLALALDGAQYVDCDVEEPNGHLFLHPVFSRRQPVTIKKPIINEAKCTFCGECSEICQFNALAVLPQKVLLFDHLCHGCGACAYFCPEHAITETDFVIGTMEFGQSNRTPFAHGILNIGEAMAAPVIKEIKKWLPSAPFTILDAPPGTNCPVVATVYNSDFCILVTEATPFGLNDLKLAVAMLQNLGVPYGVVINKADLGNDSVVRYCQQEGIPVLLSIPFSRTIAENYSSGKTLIAAKPEFKNILRNMFMKIKDILMQQAELHAILPTEI